jgi:ADP-heptose:LPS heptosyltransferase
MGFEFENPAPVLREEALQKPNPMGEKSGKWVGVAPFSAHRGKTYPEAMSEELVGLLAGEYERVFIHSGGGSEAEFAQRMETKHKNVTALYGKVKLGDELNLIAHLDCIVSMDSVAMHMASLTATPVVSIWGATHPALGFLGWGCDERGVLQEEMKCRPCSVYGERKCRSGSYKCLKVITPQMVADKVKELVG